MASPTTSTSPTSEPGLWEEQTPSSSSRSRSRRVSEQRARRRSPNRIQPRPAKPTVINSILDSLDTLAPPPFITGEDRFSDTESGSSRPSRPRSPQGTINSLHSVAPSPSPGFGVEYGMGLALDDEEGTSDAALPPTIRTSRPPSGMSSYSASRRPSYTGISPGAALRAPSIISRRSSHSSLRQVKGGSALNKLSAASWVKQDAMSHETFETRGTKESRRSRRSLRRITSQESLRPARTEIHSVPPASDEEGASPPPNISRAEQIIAMGRAPARSSKKRLYLTDAGSEEQLEVESPIKEETVFLVPEVKGTSEEEENTVVEKTPKPTRWSPQESPILDSIPMRTSSLRHSSKSPNPGRKKERKPKRQSGRNGKVDSKVSSMEEEDVKPIPEDSSWADLGDDDETVKRIRELREQRKSRLSDQRAFSMPDGLPTVATAGREEVNDMVELPGTEKENVQPEFTSARRADEAFSKRASRTLRPGPNRAATVDTPPKAKALKVLGLTDDIGSQRFSSSTRASAEIVRQRKYSLDLNRPYTRPATAQSSHSTNVALSLDYSYAQAVDALQGTEGEILRRKETPSVKPSPLKTTYLDLVSADTPLRESSPAASSRKASTKRRPEHRWTHHPDLPLDPDRKKSRRKSTSDARPGREGSHEVEPVPRRDSVEIAVLEYLQHARLSRKLRHPQTGRIISFSEVGDPNGAAVFVCLGMGLTRYVTAFYDELATTLRLRLITLDRPGVGSSEPYPSNDRSGPLSWPDDVLAVCQHLGIQTFSLLAHSAGAIYALASALILPHMIQGKVHLLGPWIPPSQLEAVSHSATTAPPAAALPRSQRFLRVLPTPFLKAANSSFMTATSASLKPGTKRSKTSAKLETIHQDAVLPAPPTTTAKRPSSAHDREPRGRDFQRRESLMTMDQYMPAMPAAHFPPEEPPEDHASALLSATASPTDPTFAFASSALSAAAHEAQRRKADFSSRLTQYTWELATKDSNPATDLLVCLERNRDVGFRYTDVAKEVVITHGAEDRRVPVGNVRWLGEQMRRGGEGGTNGNGNGRGCEVRVLEGEGHGLMASAGVMGDVLTEIAGYWVGGRGRV